MIKEIAGHRIAKDRRLAYLKIANAAMIFALAVMVSACDRFNLYRICVDVSDQPPTIAEELNRAFFDAMSDCEMICHPHGENSSIFEFFDKTEWYFLFCTGYNSRTTVDFGRSDQLVFARLHQISSGLRGEPDDFARLRSSIVAAFARVVGRENVEVVNMYAEQEVWRPAYTFEP